MTCSFHLIKKVHLEWEVKSFSLLIFCSTDSRQLCRAPWPAPGVRWRDWRGAWAACRPRYTRASPCRAWGKTVWHCGAVYVQCRHQDLIYSRGNRSEIKPTLAIMALFLNCSLTKYQNIEKWPRFTSTKSLPLHQLTERFPFKPQALVNDWSQWGPTRT